MICVFGLLKNFVRNSYKRYCARHDAKVVREILTTMFNADDNELIKMNRDWHEGIALDKKMGIEISKPILFIDYCIEQEMHRRSLKTMNDIEDEAMIGYD